MVWSDTVYNYFTYICEHHDHHGGKILSSCTSKEQKIATKGKPKGLLIRRTSPLQDKEQDEQYKEQMRPLPFWEWDKYHKIMQLEQYM